MNLDNISLDFDINAILESIKDIFFKTVRTIFLMFLILPTWVKVTFSIVLLFIVIGIGYLTWKYRDEWKYVKY